MNRRSTILLSVLWALVLAPLLSAGGILWHSCDCGKNHPCGQEVSCTQDPSAATQVVKAKVDPPKPAVGPAWHFAAATPPCYQIANWSDRPAEATRHEVPPSSRPSRRLPLLL